MSTACFAVDAGRPRSHAAPADELAALDDPGTCDVIQDCFDIDAEPLTLRWHATQVSLSYKYDLSFMCDDVTAMVIAVASADRGQVVIGFPSSGFRAVWTLTWGDGRVRVDADWDDVGAATAALRARPTIELTTRAFLDAWRRPLEIAAAALAGSGYDLARVRGVPALHHALALLA